MSKLIDEIKEWLEEAVGRKKALNKMPGNYSVGLINGAGILADELLDLIRNHEGAKDDPE